MKVKALAGPGQGGERTDGKSVPRGTFCAHNIKSDAKGLADFLLHKPHIQQRLADLVDYTPNRWLLTQEIAHIRARRKIHGRRPREFNGDPYEWAREMS